jgi:hypothetical protein
MGQLNQIPWGVAVAVFMGTLPLLGVMVWNMVEVKEIRRELSLIRTEITKLTERLAILEERDRQRPGLVSR